MSEAEKLGNRIAELSAYIHAATAELIALLREFDEQRYWEASGFPSCVSWLNFHCGLGPGSAREHLRVARPENEEFLLRVAKHGTAAHMERLVSQYRRMQTLQQPDVAQEIYLAREVTYHYDDDGCLVMKARMPADRGEVIVKALERAMDGAFDKAGDEDEKIPVAARRADALAGIAEVYLNDPGNKGSTADRYMVTLHVSAETSQSHLHNGPCVSAETSERVSCDCSTCTVEEDGHGEPLNIGRKSRQIPPGMRRALWARDGGCRFPGCNNHKFCDGHHIEHWREGGETRLDNLVLLCRHHHHLVHEGGFACKKGADGEIFFEDQREQRLKDFQESEPVSIEEALAWMYRKYEDANVSAETCRAQWNAGETLDTDYAVWVMANIQSADA